MANRTADDLAIVVSASTQQLAGDLRQAVRMLEGFQRAAQRTAGDVPTPAVGKADLAGIKAQADSLKELERQARKMRDAVDGDGGIFRRVNQGARGAAGSVAGFAARTAAASGVFLAMEAGLDGVAGAFNQVKDSIKLAADLEQTQIAFEVLLKSATAAKEMIADVRKFAATTPFNNKELIASARSLLAYGVSADQVLPTMRMLGDVSAAFGKNLPIDHLTFLYGTAFAQQRLYAKDVQQFTQAGIPYLEELAKVAGKPAHELKDFVEDGRHVRDQMTAVFRNMTAEGGRFHGMTLKQSKSMHGLAEAAADAFAMVKTKFGQAVIDEVGLKDAARDLDAFAKRLDRVVEDSKPAIRFVGELTRGVVQLGYEGIRAGAEFTRINARAIGDAFPGLGRAADDFARLVKSAQEFKFDKKALQDTALSVGRVLVTSIDETIKAWNTIKDEVIDPLAAGAKRADDAWQAFGRTLREIRRERDELINAARGNLPDPPFLKDGRPAPRPDPLTGRRTGDPIPTTSLQPFFHGMSADRIREEWRALQRDIRVAQLTAESDVPSTREFGRATLTRLRVAERGALGSFADPEAAYGKLNRGDVPAMGPWARPPAVPDLPPPPAKRDGTVLGRWNQLENAFREQWKFDDQMTAEAAAGKAVADELQRTADRFRLIREDLGGAFLGFDPLGGLAGVAVAAVQKRQEIVAGPGVKLTGDPDPFLVELARDITKKFDPMKDILKFRDDLDRLKTLKDREGKPVLANPAFADRAFLDRLREEADKLGIGGPARLSDAAMVGTAEDARILSHFATAGSGRQSAEQLLELIRQGINRLIEENARQTGVQRDILRNKPVVVNLPD